jgi:hypothetical protein
MSSLGIALIAIGIGSLWMHDRGTQYVFLEWADSMQPYFGGFLIVLGVALYILGRILRRSRAPRR